MAYSLTYAYNSTSESYTVTSYSNITTSDKVVIPSTYDDGTSGEHPVTSIGSSAFRDCSGLTSVTIPDSVTRIGDYAFYYCSSLTSVNIPDGVTYIGDDAFYSCSKLTSITIPDGVTRIGDSTFYNCSSLMSVTIGNGVTSIVGWAFQNCSKLTSVTIPNSVTSIGKAAFNGCTSLKQVILFPSTPPTLGSSAIPTNIPKIYVQQSSKVAYQAATNWTAFASKIVSDNIYLSFVRFNQKNKEYIEKKLKTSWENLNGSYVVAPSTDGTAGQVLKKTATGTEWANESGKLYLHKVTINDSAVTKLIELSFVNSNSNKITNITQNIVNTAIKCYASPTTPPTYYECDNLPISIADGNIEVNYFISYPFDISNTNSVSIGLATAVIQDYVYEL